MTDQELKDLVASLSKTTANLAQAQKKTDEQLAQTDAQLAKTDAQLAKTDAKIQKIAELVGGISNNNGYFAEETFKQALEKNPRLGDVAFDEVSTNWKKRKGPDEAEFDIVLLNGSAVGVVEVKYRLHPDDVGKFVTKKLPLFKKIFPEYNDTTVYGAVASMSYSEGAVEEAKKAGLYALAIQGQELTFL